MVFRIGISYIAHKNFSNPSDTFYMPLFIDPDLLNSMRKSNVKQVNYIFIMKVTALT